MKLISIAISQNNIPDLKFILTYSAQKDLMIDFRNYECNADDIHVLTHRMDNMEEEQFMRNSISSENNSLCCGVNCSNQLPYENNDYEGDVSNFLQEQDTILRRMEARNRSNARCVGEKKMKGSIIPCLGFHDCMMIQDD